MTDSNSVETPKDFGEAPESIVRRWLLELKLADKAEKDWRDDGDKLWKRYRSEERKKNSFPILWANTETLRPAIYNSPPKPDVRRRFRDVDPLGKATSEVLSRSLEFSIDCYSFDLTIKQDVLDMLIPGRAVSRVRYVPSIQPGEDTGSVDQLDWEQAALEHVQWNDFRHGPGKTWDAVRWIGFRHRLSRDGLIEQFGEEIGNAIPLDDTGDDELKQLDASDPVSRVFKTAEIWEIWDKDDKRVLFISKAYKKEPLKTVDDPLNLQGFFPVPCPLYAIEDSQSLIPVAIFTQYEEQANELDRISTRINKIVDACKVRGIYDSTMGELQELMRGADNDLIPAQNLAVLLERGGIDKFIWFMPVEAIANVLQLLYQQRESCKQIIYEITGIADILRGASDPNETLGAQELKAQFGSQRLKKLQGNVQRYIRDLMRLMAEIIGEKFQVETLQAMTGLNFPTEQQNQQILAQWQQQAALAQSQQQPPPPQPKLQPSWEQITAVLKNNAQRSYKVDIETDSTIAANLQSDMTGLNQLLQGIVQIFEGLAPAVMQKVLPVDALKEIVMAVTRRAKLGSAVEDALDKIQEPAPQADPAQQKQLEAQKQALDQQQKQLTQQQNDLEKKSIQHQADVDVANAKLDASVEVANAKLDTKNQAIELATKAMFADHERNVQAMVDKIIATLAAHKEAAAQSQGS